MVLAVIGVLPLASCGGSDAKIASAPIPTIAGSTGSFDDIAIDQTDGADTGGSEIESGRRAKPPGADKQDLRPAQLHLALATYLAENNLTAVSLNLLFSEFHLEDVLR